MTMEFRVGIISYVYVTKYPKFRGLKQYVYYLVISMGSEAGHGLIRALQNSNQKLNCHLKA
jgi:hypothetical protein